MELQLVQNEQFKVRKAQYQGDTWFVGRDVGEILGYKNPNAALLMHVEEDDRKKVEVSTQYGPRSTVIINEIGLYSLVLGSKLPEAKQFKRWICGEVIPSIRRTGAYMTSETLGMVQGNPEALQELTAKLAEERAKHNETLQLLGQHEQTIREKEELIERKNAYFVRNKPRIDFAKAVFENRTAILVGEMAKLLAQNGIEIGQNRFFEWLRQNGYLQSKQGEMWNVPYQKCIEQGLFIIKESVTTDARGKQLITRTPMITGKGQRYFISKFLETKDEEALAAINEEELRLQSEEVIKQDSGQQDSGQQAPAAELNTTEQEAQEDAQLAEMEELEGIDKEADELESIAEEAADVKASADEVDELEAISIAEVTELEDIAS